MSSGNRFGNNDPQINSRIGEIEKLLVKTVEHFKQEVSDAADAIVALTRRVKELEAREHIDDELVSEMGKALGRIDDIERRGFRFVGKYQAPNTYKLGDVVSYSDKLWHCVQDAKAGDRPVTASHKWSLMLASGSE